MPLIIAVASIRIAIPAFGIDHAPGLLSRRLPEYYAAAIEEAQCASPIPVDQLNQSASDAVAACRGNAACLAVVGRELGVQFILVGTLSKLDQNYSTQLEIVSVQARSVTRILNSHYTGMLKGFGASVRKLAPDICRAVNPAWVDPSVKAAEADLAALSFDTTGIQAAPPKPQPKPAPKAAADDSLADLNFEDLPPMSDVLPPPPTTPALVALPPHPAPHATSPVAHAKASLAAASFPPPGAAPVAHPKVPSIVAAVTPGRQARVKIPPTAPKVAAVKPKAVEVGRVKTPVPPRPAAALVATNSPSRSQTTRMSRTRTLSAPHAAPPASQPAVRSSRPQAVAARRPAPRPHAARTAPRVAAAVARPALHESGAVSPSPRFLLGFVPMPASGTARTLSYVLMGGAGLTAAIGGGFGAGTLAASHARLVATSLPAYNASQNNAVTRSRVTNASFAVAGVAAVTSLVFWFVGDHFFHDAPATSQASVQ